MIAAPRYNLPYLYTSTYTGGEEYHHLLWYKVLYQCWTPHKITKIVTIDKWM